MDEMNYIYIPITCENLISDLDQNWKKQILQVQI